MTKKINIQMKLVSIKEISFKMLPNQVGDDVEASDIALGISNVVQTDVVDNRISIDFGVRYVLGNEIVLESIYRFMFHVQTLSVFVPVGNDGIVTVSHIMPQMLSIAVGTMRGILVVKTAGTNLSKYPIPMIDPNELNNNLSMKH